MPNVGRDLGATGMFIPPTDRVHVEGQQARAGKR
jgi:hypothetical protein